MIGYMENKKSNYDKVVEITEQLEKGVKEVFQSENYINYLKTMSKFHQYSLNNTLLIAMQRPDATLVAGYKAWQDKFDRHVKKGEKGIRILVPFKYKYKKKSENEEETKQDTPENGMADEEERIYFKPKMVFDVSSTEGKELPQLGISELLGNVKDYKKMISVLEKICPVPISFEDIPSGAKGYYHLKEERIVVQKDMSEVQTVKTLIHEMSHERLHSIKPGEKSKDMQTRGSKEVEAESVAYCVCNFFEIDTSDYSFGYVVSWSQDKELPELKESLKIIRSTTHEFITEITEALEKERELEASLKQDPEKEERKEAPDYEVVGEMPKEIETKVNEQKPMKRKANSR